MARIKQYIQLIAVLIPFSCSNGTVQFSETGKFDVKVPRSLIVNQVKAASHLKNLVNTLNPRVDEIFSKGFVSFYIARYLNLFSVELELSSVVCCDFRCPHLLVSRTRDKSPNAD